MMKKSLLVLMSSLFLCLFLAGCGSHKVTLTDYITVSVTGGDGIGRASAYVETDLLASEIMKGLNSKDPDAYWTAHNIANSVSVSSDKRTDLSNGDSIVTTISWNTTLADNYKIKFSGDTVKTKVSDLTKRVTLDLFDGVELIPEGVSPNATILVRNTSSNKLLENVRYNVNPYRGANGDEVTVSASYSSSVISNDEYIIDVTEKTFTLSGADEYISAYVTIDDAAWTRLTNQADDVLSTTFATASTYMRMMHGTSSTYGFDMGSVNITSKNLVSSYFANFKDGLSMSYSDVYNSIYLVYEVVFTDSKTAEPATRYITVYCKNFIQRGSGECYFEIGDVSANAGYTNVEALKAAVVDTNKAKYEFTETSHKA